MTVSSEIESTCPGLMPGQAQLLGSGGFTFRLIILIETGIGFVAGLRFRAVVLAALTVIGGLRADPAAPRPAPALRRPLPAPPVSAGRARPDRRRCRP